MLKLLLVDDEEIICNTIARVIPWDELGITLIGTCLDGVDAYHTILDESPDIVMTDIRMPGISGLELIERISHTNLNTQFIILSGYGEFDYAKRAMKCGVRHYLLKPCDNQQIIECLKAVIKDCQELYCQKEAFASNNQLFKNLHYALIQNIIGEGIALPEGETISWSSYEKYLDFTETPYQLCRVFYLEKKYLNSAIQIVDTYFENHAPHLTVYKVYISNVLLLFFPNFRSDYESMDCFFSALSFPNQKTSIVYDRTTYADLSSLLEYLICKLKRFDVFYFVIGNRLLSNFNYEQMIASAKQLCPALLSSDNHMREENRKKLQDILSAISSRDFLLQLSAQVLLTISTQLCSANAAYITEFLSDIQKEHEISVILNRVMSKVDELVMLSQRNSASYSPFIEELLRYLEAHVSDSNLTLKWIAENHLYMNVNYVSRCFVNETHQKFSTYLTNLRVQKAKEILSSQNMEKIQNVAELVGCGNNPCYFSKIFKKSTGMTPSAYIRNLQGNRTPS